MSDFPDLSGVVNRGAAGGGQPPQPMPYQPPPPVSYGADPGAPAAPVAPASPPINWSNVVGRGAAALALVAAVVGTGYVLSKGEGGFSANDDDDDEDDEDDLDEVEEAEAQMRATPRPSSAFAPNPPRRRGRR